MGRPPSPDQDKFIIRLPDGMRDQISEAAKASGRTMTAEIVTRLRASFETGGAPFSAHSTSSLDEAVAELRTDLGKVKRRVGDLEKQNERRLPPKSS